MSNRPKNVNRIGEYTPTKGEVFHRNEVRRAVNGLGASIYERTHGVHESKHQGSKPLRVLYNNNRRCQ